MTLKIEAGKFYRTRDGRKVGPMFRWSDISLHPFEMRGHRHEDFDIYNSFWDECGKSDESTHADLIAEWTDTIDLTAITTAFGLLPPETQQALRDHVGPVEFYEHPNWRVKIAPVWAGAYIYRVKTKPKRDTVTIYGAPDLGAQWVYTQCEHDTHRITFDLLDGKPDPASIRMEEL